MNSPYTPTSTPAPRRTPDHQQPTIDHGRAGEHRADTTDQIHRNLFSDYLTHGA